MKFPDLYFEMVSNKSLFPEKHSCFVEISGVFENYFDSVVRGSILKMYFEFNQWKGLPEKWKKMWNLTKIFHWSEIRGLIICQILISRRFEAPWKFFWVELMVWVRCAYFRSPKICTRVRDGQIRTQVITPSRKWQIWKTSQELIYYIYILWLS